jgi:hypothetical protein
MSINQITTSQEIEQHFINKMNKRVDRIVEHLAYVGECCIKEARESGSYQDRTGNLRSSVGYIVSRDGNIVLQGGFSKGDGGEFAQSLVGNYTTGVVLFVVAGMNYAKYVSAKGYNVLDSAELLTKRLMKQLFNENRTTN